jgi:hypothetical protein
VQGLLCQLHGGEGVAILAGTGVHCKAVAADSKVMVVAVMILEKSVECRHVLIDKS